MMKMSNADIGFSEDEIQQMLDNIDTFTPDEAMEIDKLVDELNNRKAKQGSTGRPDSVLFVY
jgi:hypothetical protein